MRNTSGKLVRINTELERKIINELLDKQLLGSGSSRMVFELPDHFAAEIGIPTENPYVVKVVIGKGGVHQMNQELDVWEQYFDTSALANIWAFGRYIEIMDSIDVQDLDDYFCFEEEDISEEDAALRDRMFWLKDTLDDITGCTSDNFQNGFDNDGNLVVYDYGFEPSLGTSHYCSSLRDVVCREEARAEYLGKLIKLLEEDEFVMQSIRQVEADMCYDYDEEDEPYDDEEEEVPEEDEEEDSSCALEIDTDATGSQN